MKVRVKLTEDQEEIDLSDHVFKAISPDTLAVEEITVFSGFTVHSKAIADFITLKLGWQYTHEQESDPYFFPLHGQLTKQEIVEGLASIFDKTMVVE